MFQLLCSKPKTSHSLSPKWNHHSTTTRAIVLCTGEYNICLRSYRRHRKMTFKSQSSPSEKFTLLVAITAQWHRHHHDDACSIIKQSQLEWKTSVLAITRNLENDSGNWKIWNALHGDNYLSHHSKRSPLSFHDPTSASTGSTLLNAATGFSTCSSTLITHFRRWNFNFPLTSKNWFFKAQEQIIPITQ